MKNIFWILLIIVIAAAIAAYMDPDIKNLILESTGQMQTKSKVYKWKDSQGNWQISNTPPAKGMPYTEQEYLHNTNIVPPLQTTE
jgi:hypothetical protein